MYLYPFCCILQITILKSFKINALSYYCRHYMSVIMSSMNYCKLYAISGKILNVNI